MRRTNKRRRRAAGSSHLRKAKAKADALALVVAWTGAGVTQRARACGLAGQVSGSAAVACAHSLAVESLSSLPLARIKAKSQRKTRQTGGKGGKRPERTRVPSPKAFPTTSRASRGSTSRPRGAHPDSRGRSRGRRSRDCRAGQQMEKT